VLRTITRGPAGGSARLCQTTRSRTFLPWIPPRAVCHVDVGSIIRPKSGGREPRGLYSTPSFLPTVLEGTAYVHENIGPRSKGPGGLRHKAERNIVSLGRDSASILIEGNFDQLPERHDTVLFFSRQAIR